jgi:hypothetical protein
MRFAAVATAVVVAVVVAIGCGDGDASAPSRSPPKAAGALANGVSAWSDATTSYYATLQQCGRQPNPVRGYMTACTREWRLNYDRAMLRLLRALSSELRSPKTCAKAVAQMRSLAIQVQGALRTEFSIYSASLDTGRYRGHATGSRAVGLLLGKAEERIARSMNTARTLGRAIQANCT